MLVFSSARLVFLSVPKTGTTAYERALAPFASMIVSAPPELKHAPIFRYNRFFRPVLEKFIGEDLTVIAVMRDPLDWLGSWYRFRRRDEVMGQRISTHDVSFDGFVQAYLQGKKPAYAQVGSQAKFLEPQANGTAATHLFRYEEPDALIAFLDDRLGITLKTDILNPSPKMDLKLSDKTHARFARKCAHEYALWSSIKRDGSYTPLPARAD